ncbi:MAG TPA: hypothetical protein VGC21_03190 [Telluria sp.]|jgi:hypothetical protein
MNFLAILGLEQFAVHILGKPPQWLKAYNKTSIEIQKQQKPHTNKLQ